MFVSQLLRTLAGGAVAAGGLSVKRGAVELGWLIAAVVLGGWCLMVALLALGAAAWLALAPQLGAAGASAIVGLLFLILTGLVYWAHRRRRLVKRAAQRLDAAAADAAAGDIQQQILQSVNANIGPLLIAAVGAFLVSRLTRRD
jgi:hypothetical protein